jgi:hypothetical protein
LRREGFRSKHRISAVAGPGGALYALFTEPGGAYAEGAAPDPGSCPVSIAGAARDPDFCIRKTG